MCLDSAFQKKWKEARNSALKEKFILLLKEENPKIPLPAKRKC